MRVLVAALPTAHGGGLILINDLLRAWPIGDEIMILARRPETVEVLRATGHQLVQVQAQSTFRAVAMVARRPKEVEDFRPDVVWSQAFRLPWRNMPQAVHWQDVGSFESVHARKVKHRVRTVRELYDIHRAELRVFNSHAMSESAIAAYPSIAGKLSRVIPNGLELSLFFAAATHDPPEDGVLRILLPQSDSPHKRNALAADVLAKVNDTLPNRFASVKLLVPGSGNYTDLVGRLAHHNLAHTLELRGPLNRCEMASLYSESHAVLITSRGESFCNPAIEAAAVGRPLIAPPIPALQETGGPSATIVSSWDPDALAAAIVERVGEPESRARLVEAQLHARRFSAGPSAHELRKSLAVIASQNRQ